MVLPIPGCSVSETATEWISSSDEPGKSRVRPSEENPAFFNSCAPWRACSLDRKTPAIVSIVEKPPVKFTASAVPQPMVERARPYHHRLRNLWWNVLDRTAHVPQCGKKASGVAIPRGSRWGRCRHRPGFLHLNPHTKPSCFLRGDQLAAQQSVRVIAHRPGTPAHDLKQESGIDPSELDPIRLNARPQALPHFRSIHPHPSPLKTW